MVDKVSYLCFYVKFLNLMEYNIVNLTNLCGQQMSVPQGLPQLKFFPRSQIFCILPTFFLFLMNPRWRRGRRRGGVRTHVDHPRTCRIHSSNGQIQR